LVIALDTPIRRNKTKQDTLGTIHKKAHDVPAMGSPKPLMKKTSGHPGMQVKSLLCPI
jgi:hypothetical protein